MRIERLTEDARDARRLSEPEVTIDFAAAAQTAIARARVATAIHLAQISESQHQHAMERGERS